MTENLKHYLYIVFSKLSTGERREIIAYLKDMNLNSDTDFKDVIDEIRKKCYSSGLSCPHRESKKVVRFGSYRSFQHYLCKLCKKTFTDLSKTALHYIHNKEKFFNAIRLILEGYSLTKTAEIVKVSIPTAFNWRHKIQENLHNLEDCSISGIVEA